MILFATTESENSDLEHILSKVDSDETAPIGAVSFGSTLFAKA